MRQLLSTQLKTSTDPTFNKDWTRQLRTANDILNRLETQEGVILADQVGMGKTYVALAVVASYIRSTPKLGRVVIFVPAAVAEKWVREWRKFSQSLLAPDHGIRCVSQPIRSGEEFLSKLDTPSDEHILVVTHTALTNTLKDSFIQLALLHYATRYIQDRNELRARIAKWSNGKRGLIRNPAFTPDRVAKLLQVAPSKWRGLWLQLTGEKLTNNPVPTALERAAKTLVLDELRTAIKDLPIRTSTKIEDRLASARSELGNATQAAWKWLLSATDLNLPLLVVDEAHRLKNPYTRISRLFAQRTEDDHSGAFHGIFERMLFLTATPFELGHTELIEILSRLSATRTSSSKSQASLSQRLQTLQEALTAAQSAALHLDNTWGKLTHDDLALFDSWSLDSIAPTTNSQHVHEAWEHAKLAVHSRQKMNVALKPWIIRHERSKRRTYHPGASILANGARSVGLSIPEEASLPFLLAARAQSIAANDQNSRPHFAYGIVSSYETYQRLGNDQTGPLRDSDSPKEDQETQRSIRVKHHTSMDSASWYRDEIKRVLQDAELKATHPKVRATVERAAHLWLQGEKCLIFCWYLNTGEAVAEALSQKIQQITHQIASKALKIRDESEVQTALKRISDRLFRSEGTSYSRIRQRLTVALEDASQGNQEIINLLVDSAIRHLRTPSYLVRYATLSLEMTEQDIWEGINKTGPNGTTLLKRWQSFAKRLALLHQKTEATNPDGNHSEINHIRTALLGDTSPDESSEHRGGSLNPVRRAHGGTDRATRERLIAQFNTPFLPDLLVASSVMGEGIDLHQECRFVIHHDLDWNPSILEQRTGRLDRIGAYAERENQHIEIYEPYLAGTHDEKMYRVVKDRAQWFDIVMGRASKNDEYSTDVEEQRPPLHPAIHHALAMDLRSPE